MTPRLIFARCVLLLLSLTLVGCGVGDSESSSSDSSGGNPPPQQAVSTLHTMDVTLRAAYSSADRLVTIDLDRYVLSEGKTQKARSLVSVEPVKVQLGTLLTQKQAQPRISGHCQVLDLDSEHLRFTVPTNRNGLCLYRYTVEDSAGERATNLARILTAPAKNGQRLAPITAGRHKLPDIHKAINMGDTLSLDLQAELLAVDPSLSTTLTNVLFSEATAAFGNGTALLTEDGQLTFTPTAPGISQVVYFVLDDNSTPYEENALDDTVHMGRVNLDVSGVKTNTPPTAKVAMSKDMTNLTYDSLPREYDLRAFDNLLGAGVESLISDPDGDDKDVQLINVSSSDVGTWVSNPNDVFNTKFKIKPRAGTISGEETLSPAVVHYTVYDHNEEGYASNDITFSVKRHLTRLWVYPVDHSFTAGTSKVVFPNGTSASFGAIGWFDDGSSQNITTSPELTWSSSSASVATIDGSGVASAHSMGETIVTATYNSSVGVNLDSNKVTLEVSDAALTSVWITPSLQTLPLGTDGKITAIGQYTDGTTKTISDLVTWQVDPIGPPSIIEVDTSLSGPSHPEADVLTRSEGRATITATIDGLTTNEAVINVRKIITRLQLTPTDIKLAKGLTQTMALDGIYSDGSAIDISNSTDVAWRVVEPGSSTPSNVATFPSLATPNVVEALNKGQAHIIATYKGMDSNPTLINVTNAKIKSLQLTPALTNLPQGLTVNMLVMGTFEDGTQREITNSPWLTWEEVHSPAGTTPASYAGHGIFRTSDTDTGTTTVTAHFQGKESNKATINVSDAIVKDLKITTPEPVNIPIGTNKQLNATAYYSNGTSRDVTEEASWSTAEIDTATITSALSSGNGIATAATGPTSDNTTATATLDGQSDTVTLHITPAIPTAIEVTPLNPSIAKGLHQQLTAILVMSDGTSGLDVTTDDNTDWTIDTTVSAITIGNAVGASPDKGEVYGGELGTGTVKTTYNNGAEITGTTEVTITEARIVEVNLTPLKTKVDIGDTIEITATAKLTDGNELPIGTNTDSSTTWYSTSDGSGSDATVEYGTVTGVAHGKVAISTTTSNPHKPIPSNEPAIVNVTCGKLDGDIIDVVEAPLGSGQVFTSSPSLIYLNSHLPSVERDGTSTENCSKGPDGVFATFKPQKAESLCLAYNDIKLYDRTNWQLATETQLKDELYRQYGNMFDKFIWPAGRNYRASTVKEVAHEVYEHYAVNLVSGELAWGEFAIYASCVSSSP